jgi:hypothetical protein
METLFNSTRVSRSFVIKAFTLAVCLLALAGAAAPAALGQDIRVRIYTRSSCSEGDAQLNTASGVAVNLGGGDIVTDSTGYALVYMRPGLYNVRASLPGASFAFIDRTGDATRYRPASTGYATIPLNYSEETLQVRMLTCSTTGAAAGVVVTPGTAAITISPGAGGITVSTGGAGVAVGVVQTRRARLTNISNNVEVQINGGYWVRPAEGMEIGAGDNVRTGMLSSVTVNFWDGHTGQVKERSQLQLRSNGAWLNYGEIRVSTAQPRQSPSDFEISTAACTINVRGTIFTVNHVEPDTSTVVWVEDGTIMMTPSNRSLAAVNVYSGQEVRVTRSYMSPVSTRGAAVIVGTPGTVVVTSTPVTGVWVTSTGDIVQLTQDGARVTGTYRGVLGNGVLAGVMDGGVFRGTITIGQGMNAVSGNVVLTPMPDGRLEGTVSSSVYNGPWVFTRSSGVIR